MSQKRKPTTRQQRLAPQTRQSNKTSIAYIVIVSVMVFSLVIAGLASVDWSNLFPGSTEPTPDYNTDQVAIQQTVVAQNPDDPAEQMLLASMMASTGRMQEAVPIFEGAIRLDPENEKYRLDFAMALQNNGMSADAEVQFLRVLEISPNNHTAHYYLGRLYLDWQPRRREEAVEHLQKVIEIAPDSFYASQAESVLNTLGPATPVTYEVTPIASPTYGQ